MAELSIRRASRRLERLENEASESRIQQATLRQYPLEAERARHKAILAEIVALEARLHDLLDEEESAGVA
jgi:hypothetical protein